MDKGTIEMNKLLQILLVLPLIPPYVELPDTPAQAIFKEITGAKCPCPKPPVKLIDGKWYVILE